MTRRKNSEPTPAEAKARELDETERLARAGRTVPEIARAQRITQACVRARLRYRKVKSRTARKPRLHPLHEYTALARLLSLAKLLRGREPFSAATAAKQLATSERTIKRDVEFLRRAGWGIVWSNPHHTYALIRAPKAILL